MNACVFAFMRVKPAAGPKTQFRIISLFWGGVLQASEHRLASWILQCTSLCRLFFIQEGTQKCFKCNPTCSISSPAKQCDLLSTLRPCRAGRGVSMAFDGAFSDHPSFNNNIRRTPLPGMALARSAARKAEPLLRTW